jgi:hypothetical protein
MAEGRLPNWVDPTARGTTAWEETTWDMENENGTVVRGDDPVAHCLLWTLAVHLPAPDSSLVILTYSLENIIALSIVPLSL